MGIYDQLAEKAAEIFNLHFGQHKAEDFVEGMSDSIDMELWDKEGFSSIKNSKRIITDDPKQIVYEADIIGDIIKLQKDVENDIGRRVILRKRN